MMEREEVIKGRLADKESSKEGAAMTSAGELAGGTRAGGSSIALINNAKEIESFKRFQGRLQSEDMTAYNNFDVISKNTSSVAVQ